VKAISQVLCPVDFSRETGPEIALAQTICWLFGARLVLEHNLEPRPPSYLGMIWMWSEEHERHQRELGEDAERRLREGLAWLSRTVPCEAKLTRGPIDTSLLWLARALPADLIVMASHGRSSSQHRSLTEEIVARASSPVLALGHHVESSRLRVGERPDQLRLLVPIEGDEPEASVLESVELLESIAPVEVERVRVERHPTLAEKADRFRADLIVAPVHRRRAFRRRGQAIDAELLHESRCPVWFVPPGVKPSSAEVTG
jgi:nucleotide-binding universal stress UspA family protein